MTKWVRILTEQTRALYSSPIFGFTRHFAADSTITTPPRDSAEFNSTCIALATTGIVTEQLYISAEFQKCWVYGVKRQEEHAELPAETRSNIRLIPVNALWRKSKFFQRRGDKRNSP